jgi:hypothetical protein
MRTSVSWFFYWRIKIMFEDIILLLLGGGAIFYIGIPLAQLIKRLMPTAKKRTLEEAQERLEQAKLDVEAARLNKEAEKIYNHLYEDVLQDDDVIKQDDKHRRV